MERSGEQLSDDLRRLISHAKAAITAIGSEKERAYMMGLASMVLEIEERQARELLTVPTAITPDALREDGWSDITPGAPMRKRIDSHRYWHLVYYAGESQLYIGDEDGVVFVCTVHSMQQLRDIVRAVGGGR